MPTSRSSRSALPARASGARPARGAPAARFAAALLLGACLLPSHALADAPEYARPGLFARLGAAVGFENAQLLRDLNARLPAALVASGSLPPTTVIEQALVEVDPLLGVSVGAGHRFHPRFSLEAAFDWAQGDFDLTVTGTAPVVGTRTSTTPLGTWTAWTLTTDAKVYLATGALQPFATIGLGAMRETIAFTTPTLGLTSATATAFVPRFGGGLDVHLTRNVALQLDAGYLLGTGDLDGADLVLLRLGLLARF